MMSESFRELFESSLEQMNMSPGSIVKGQVVQIQPDFVVINAGLKSEALVPLSQFKDSRGRLEVAVGDEVDVALDAVADGFGETRLSREKAKRSTVWDNLDRAYDNNETVTGVINGKVKGGFTVDIHDIRAFLPGSLVDVRPVRDPSYLEGKELEFKVIKLDRQRNNLVVSRRAVVESEFSAEREELLDKLEEGSVVKGVVKNLTDYGAFIDLGGIDGLLHITDMSWKRVRHPSEVVNVGDEVEVRILKFDRERNRVSLGLKQLGEDPWVDIARRYPVGARMFGKISNITDYGCFVEIEEGVEGLVHVSEMDWTNKNVNPAKLVNLGDDVEVMVLDIDEARRRTSLGMKQCQSNPWEEFAQNNQKGDRVHGSIKSITDFGIFVGLNGSIDGLVHLSDISWNATGEETVREYTKGQEIEAVVLAVDPERERISLGIKQLDQDPFAGYMAEHPKGSMVKGTVTAVDARGVTVDLGDGVEGHLRASDISQERVEDAGRLYKEGDTLEAKFVSVDRKNRAITLSIRALEDDAVADAMEEMSDESKGRTSLGDLLKEKMGK